MTITMEGVRKLNTEEVPHFYGWLSCRGITPKEINEGSVNPVAELDRYHREGPYSDEELAWYGLRYQVEENKRQAEKTNHL